MATMGDHSKRDLLMIVAAIAIIISLAAWLAIAALDHFVLHDSSDPLTKAGGLKPPQENTYVK